jgi:hypothetical protein
MHASVITCRNNIVIDELDLPVLHDLALDCGDLDWMWGGVRVCRS